MRLASPTKHLIALVMAIVMLASACSEPQRTTAQFCQRLADATGPQGVEIALAVGDPGRIDGLVVELTELHDRAPDEISGTTRTLLNFFRDYQLAARDERRDVLAENEASLIAASAKLDDYALRRCGLFLDRAVPTPRPTVDPSIEAPNE